MKQKPNPAERLLEWYDRHHRDLPWRVSPSEQRAGVKPDPYRVWLSEIMLQQTLVEAMKPYFKKFTERWPTVEALAAAESDDVMKAWAGLGYYSRARNLKKCAEAIVSHHDGVFPGDAASLKTLPGIGDYTSAAVAAIAFGKPEAVVDGNVERVTSRLHAVATPLPKAKSDIRKFVAAMVPASRPGDFAQAMMDLGATICTPRRPACILCPLNENCRALAAGDPERFPVKAPKKEKPERRGAAFVAVNRDGAVLLKKRSESGLLGGMAEVPTTKWTAKKDGETSVSAAPFSADWRKTGSIRHVFTHFSLTLDVYRAEQVAAQAIDGGWWAPTETLREEALPTLMKKAIETALPGALKKPDIRQKPKGRSG